MDCHIAKIRAYMYAKQNTLKCVSISINRIHVNYTELTELIISAKHRFDNVLRSLRYYMLL